MSTHSHELNNLFGLSVIGVTEGFTRYNGECFSSCPSHTLTIWSGGAYWLAITGCTYHRIFPTSTPNHPAHWFLYDPASCESEAQQRSVPLGILHSVRTDLEEVNPLYHAYHNFSHFVPEEDNAYLELADPGPGGEIAALYHVGNSPYPSPRQLYVCRNGDLTPTPLNILHRLYEPLSIHCSSLKPHVAGVIIYDLPGHRYNTIKHGY